MAINIYIILIVLGCLILIYINNFSEKLETKIISEESKNYITVRALYGLNNRIQVLLSYLYFARLQDKKLKIVWITNEYCPDRFDNLFYPINNVEIIYAQIRNVVKTLVPGRVEILNKKVIKI